MPKHIIGGICKNREMDIIEKVKKYNFEDIVFLMISWPSH